jgi:aminoglycoside 6-adenylyltransferase
MEKSQITAAYDELVARFVQWAESEADIRFAVVIGSRARIDHPADEWSDLDIIFLVDDPQPYIEATTWLHKIGNPWITFLEKTASGEGFERRVLFEGGLDVDLVPESFSGFMKMLDAGPPPDVLDMIQRGVRVLVDKENLTKKLESIEMQPAVREQPAEGVYLNVVSDFWYHTVWTAKHLCRGEIWWGKSCCDSYLKNLLLRMLEWHAQAQRGVDTWIRGASWYTGLTLARLKHCLGSLRITTRKISGGHCWRRWGYSAGLREKRGI